MTPSQGIYNWVNTRDKEIIFLNDIRYEENGEKKVMPWNMFLNLLEGITVKKTGLKTFTHKTLNGLNGSQFLLLQRILLYVFVMAN